MTFPAYPITPDLQAFLTAIKWGRGRYCLHVLKIRPEPAAEEAMRLAQALTDAIQDGETLLPFVPTPNVITRELEAGLLPEEFRDGPVFHSTMRNGGSHVN